MNIDFTWVEGIITASSAAIGSLVTFIVGKHGRTKKAVSALQETIDGLALKNNELYAEIIKLRYEVAELKRENAELKEQNTYLQNQLAELTGLVKRYNHEL